MEQGVERSAPERVSSIGLLGWSVTRHVSRSARTAYCWLRPHPAGVILGTLFFCISLTPSLLPRPWLAQGLISAVALVVGYGIGSIAGRLGLLVCRLPSVENRVLAARRRVRLRPTGWVLGGSLSVLVLAAVYLGSGWQRDLYLLMGEPAPDRLGYLRVPGIALFGLAAMVAAVRALRAGGRFIVQRLTRFIPPGPLQVLSVIVTLVIVAIMAEQVAVGGFYTVAGRVSRAVNEAYLDDEGAALGPTRSGGPGSLVSWASLGAEGRMFVSGGPDREQLRRFADEAQLPGTIREPIRVYVGLHTTDDVRHAAGVAVRELDRTGAFERSVLCVVTTTGTGSVDPYLAEALEYMHRGDTAIVGIQYSYLPSWISFLSERERVVTAGPELFDQVHARWTQLPVDRRPKLIIFAESLGSLGSEAGFTGLDDVRVRTDGVLWSGPTHANPLWRQFVADREPGTPQVLPTYRNGATVRFVSRPEDLELPAPWPIPRVVYLQNPSDPVTWWTPNLLWQRPDWLEEPRGHDVLRSMHWFPVVTFLQLTADLALAYEAPPGHGHQFHMAGVPAWAAITSPPDWTATAGQKLTAQLDRGGRS